MTIEEIIKTWLKANGYDGLVNDECGCSLDEFCPCGERLLACKPAYLHDDELMYVTPEEKMTNKKPPTHHPLNELQAAKARLAGVLRQLKVSPTALAYECRHCGEIVVTDSQVWSFGVHGLPKNSKAEAERDERIFRQLAVILEND